MAFDFAVTLRKFSIHYLKSIHPLFSSNIQYLRNKGNIQYKIAGIYLGISCEVGLLLIPPSTGYPDVLLLMINPFSTDM